MTDKIRLRDIAGFCPEKAVWKMLADLSGLMEDGRVPFSPNPDNILVDGDSFLPDMSTGVEEEFLAPEQEGQETTAEQAVWALGATAYFMATGHVVFGGYGGKYQRLHPHVALPNMPKAFQALTPVLHRCVPSNPSERIDLKELGTLARKGLDACRSRKRTVGQKDSFTETEAGHHDGWPEEMTEI
jgi:serine/threonine protein kinase